MMKGAENIDRYLDGRMDAEEQRDFAHTIANDADVRSTVAAEQILRVHESVPFVPSADELSLPPVLHAALSSTGGLPGQSGTTPKPTGSFTGWTIILVLLLGTLAGIFIGILLPGDRATHPSTDARSPAPAASADRLPDQPVPPHVTDEQEMTIESSVSARTESVAERSGEGRSPLAETEESNASTPHGVSIEKTRNEQTERVTDEGSREEREQLRTLIEKRAQEAPVEHHRDSLRLKLDVE